MPSKTVTYLKDKCDNLVRQQARQIPACEICQSIIGLQVVHYISRRDIRFRFLKENWIRGCQDCHSKAHQEHGWLRTHWIRLKGIEIVKWLERESRKAPEPIRKDFYQETVRSLRFIS